MLDLREVRNLKDHIPRAFRLTYLSSHCMKWNFDYTVRIARVETGPGILESDVPNDSVSNEILLNGLPRLKRAIAEHLPLWQSINWAIDMTLGVQMALQRKTGKSINRLPIHSWLLLTYHFVTRPYTPTFVQQQALCDMRQIRGNWR